MPRRKKPASGQDLAAALLAAHGGDVRAMMRNLTAGIAERGGSVEYSGPRFTPRPRPAEPVTFRVRVDIDNAKPPIWRRLDLAGDLTLAQVHRALQSAFMWQDMHLHAFTPQIDGARDRIAPSFGNDGLDDPDAPASEDEVRLDEVVSARGDRLFYVYDMGDSWEHTLTVEDVRPRGDGPAASCIGGRRATPMEDSGGIWHYNEVVAALGGKETTLDEEDLAEAREWLGGDFDPDDPDLEGLEDLDSVVFRTGTASSSFYPNIEIVVDEDDDVLPPDLRRADPDTESLLVDNPRLVPAFAHLVDLAEETEILPILDDLTAAAELDIVGWPPGAPRADLFAGLTREEAEAVTRPWGALVQALGAGLPVPGAASPAPEPDALFALDEPTAAAVWPADRLRAAVALGLARKQGGRLYATRAGRDAAVAPVRLWRFIADGLTTRQTRDDRAIAALALLLVAGEQPAREAFTGLAPRLLPRLGLYRLSAGFSLETALAATETVWTVVEAGDGFDADGCATPAARRLARAALLTS